MPEGLRELLPTETVCLNCITPTKLIKFIFKNNSVPPGLRIEVQIFLFCSKLIQFVKNSLSMMDVLVVVMKL